MELNCRVRNSQESIKNILRKQVLNLRRYDPEVCRFSICHGPLNDPKFYAGMRECNAGDYLYFDDVMRLFE